MIELNLYEEMQTVQIFSLVIEHFNPGGGGEGGDLPATQRSLFLHSFGN